MTPRLLDPGTLETPVSGRNLREGTLGDQIGTRPTLLVFLRHLGCLFSREWLDELGRASADPAFPTLLYVHLGTPEQGETFFENLAPDARAVADPSLQLYHAFGVPRASALQLLDPRVWACGVRAVGGGYKPGKPIGDPLVMPGLFLVEGGRVTWEFVPGHMGGLPPVDRIPRLEAV